MWRILLEEFLGDLKGQKTRTVLTLLAMIWGTIAVVLLLAFGEGLKVAISSGLLNAGERMYIIWGGETSLVHEGLPKGRRIRLMPGDMEMLKRSIPDVDLVSLAYGRSNTSLKFGSNKTNTYMEAVTPEFGEMRHMFPAAGGRFLNQRDLEQKRRVLFLGDKIATELFGDTAPVGQTVTLDGLPFTVIGVMQKKFQDSNNNGPDENRAVIPASTYAAIYGGTYVNQLLIRPRQVDAALRVKTEVYRILGRRYQFAAADERALSIWDFFEGQKITSSIGFGIQIFMGMVGVFTLIVAGVGVANIMYVVVRERTREIGIKLAVGARKLHIMSQFVFEAMMLSLSGGTVGLLFSAAVVWLINQIPLSGDNAAMQYIARPALSWPIAFTCVSILVSIGLLAGLLPARRAANVDPVESLRYE
ncbi:MAG: ABC transporter permease [Gemmatimonadetes bacterium]|nr:ABC transporter permease [Gemmatimonadota bacterium]